MIPLSQNVKLASTNKLDNSVVRNKIKRRVRHMLRLAIDKALVPVSFNLLIIPYNDFKLSDFDSLYSSLSSLILSRYKSYQFKSQKKVARKN